MTQMSSCGHFVQVDIKVASHFITSNPLLSLIKFESLLLFEGHNDGWYVSAVKSKSLVLCGKYYREEALPRQVICKMTTARQKLANSA